MWGERRSPSWVCALLLVDLVHLLEMWMNMNALERLVYAAYLTELNVSF